MVGRRPRSPLPGANWVALGELRLSGSYRAALAGWGADLDEDWGAIEPPWDEAVADVVEGRAPLEPLLARLEAIARACGEVVVWYAGFPEDTPMFGDLGAWRRALREQIEAGEVEIAAGVLAGRGRSSRGRSQTW